MNRYTQLLLLCSGLYFTSDIVNTEQKTVPENRLPTVVNKAHRMQDVGNSKWTSDSTRLIMEDGKVIDKNAFSKRDFEVKVRGRRSDIFGFIRPANKAHYVTGFKSK